jgi:mannose-6-phosphate isomerase-like protein (cupin superfamily)
MMSAPIEVTVRERLLETFAYCPSETADFFCWLLLQPTATLIGRAVISLAKPYGTNHVLVAEGDFGVSFARLRPRQCTSLHYHVQRCELFCVRAGDLHLVLGDIEEHLPVGGIGESTPGIPHSLRNDGDVPLEVLELFSPAVLDDKVRIADRYDRTLGSVSLNM